MNWPLVSSFSALFLAQLLKVLFYRQRYKLWDWRLAFCSGRMPSSHSALVSALTMSLFLTYGWKSPYLSLSTVFATIVIYDSMGVRRQCGEQGFILSELLRSVRETGLKTSVDTSHESLIRYRGHTPIEVIGGVLFGIFIACLLYWINIEF